MSCCIREIVTDYFKQFPNGEVTNEDIDILFDDLDKKNRKPKKKLG